MKKRISLEYCHVTPELHWDDQIERANEYTAKFLAGFDASEVQKCIMIDDVHSQQPIDAEILEQIVSKLTVKPDSIYLESAFIPLAGEVLDRLDTTAVVVLESEERSWLRNVRDRYDLSLEFATKWKKNEVVTFACPTLAATSYLVRLGELPSVPVIWGEPLQPADLAIQFLSSFYLPVEAQAQLIIKGFDTALLDKLAWAFI